MFDKGIKDGADSLHNRKVVADLISDVLSEKTTVREALLMFPKLCKDESVVTAWHALCHYEADEELRKTDTDYQTSQDEYLVMLFEILKDGTQLPQNIIDSYEAYYKGAPVPNEKGFLGYWGTFKRVLNI